MLQKMFCCFLGDLHMGDSSNLSPGRLLPRCHTMATRAASPPDQQGMRLAALLSGTCTALPSEFLEVLLVLEGGALGIGTSLKVYLNCSQETVPALCSALLERDEKKFHRDSKSISCS